MTTQIRSGSNYDDFRPPKYFYAEPDGPRQFTKPIILLIHRYSVSAADNFAMAMRTLPHVTLVGEATSGCQADQHGAQLPNGWNFSVSYTLFVDQDGFCWEGIGILYFQNTSPSCRRFKKSATGKPFIPPFSVHGPFSEQIAEGWDLPTLFRL